MTPPCLLLFQTLKFSPELFDLSGLLANSFIALGNSKLMLFLVFSDGSLSLVFQNNPADIQLILVPPFGGKPLRDAHEIRRFLLWCLEAAEK